MAAVAVTAATLAPVGLAQGGPSGCGPSLPCLHGRLPASITIVPGRPGRRAYRIERDGHVRTVRRPRSPYPATSGWFPASGVWFKFTRGHLLVGLGRRELWRSHGVFASEYRLGSVVIGSGHVAFSYAGRLYLAGLGGAEHVAARGEYPLGWTAGGLFTYRQRGRLLLLRSATGRILARLARRPDGFVPGAVSGRLYFLTRRGLMVAQGALVTRVAQLSALKLGAASTVSLQLLGRLLELQDPRRIVLVRLDGSVFASTALPRRRGHPGTESSSPVENSSGTAAAFTIAFGQTATPNSRRRARGEEAVYLLRRGAHSAVPIHVEHVTFAICERGAELQWHGSWILYTATEGKAAAIDTVAPGMALELAPLIRRLLGGSRSFSASWG